MTTTVSMAMDAQPPVIRLGSSIGETFAVMQSRGTSLVYVVDDDNRLHGVVPDYELLKGRMLGLTPDAPVMPLICWSVNSVSPDTTVGEAAVVLRTAACRELAILRDDTLIGRISRQQILASLFPADATPAISSSETAEESSAAAESSNETHHGPEIAPPQFLRSARRARTFGA